MGRNGIRVYPTLRNVHHLFLDTMFFIYHFEQNSRYVELTSRILDSVEKGNLRCSTSYLTLMEILVKPIKEGMHDLVDEYGLVFETFPNLGLVPLGKSVAYKAAYFRARYGIKPADSIQLGFAASVECDAFLTNDKDFIRIEEVDVFFMHDIVGDH